MEILFISVLILMIFYAFSKRRNSIDRDSKYSSDTQAKYKTRKVSSKSQNKQKGDKYELQIGKSYQKQGYKVYFKGINEGLRDKGIDIMHIKVKRHF